MQHNKPSPLSCIFHWLVILLIPFSFFLGILLAYFGLLSLKIEIYTLVIVAFIFFVFVLFAKHNANYAACYMKRTFSGMEEKLHEALHANALTIMGKTKSTLHVKDFIATYYQDIRNENIARVAPSVFPMLGILGTFIAIALSMPDFTIQDTEGLDREISLLLSGVGAAFYASIYGIMLSLVWTYFEKRGISKTQKQIIDLENIYNARVWKKSELIKHRHMQSELKDQQIVQTLKETFSMDFIRDINEQYLKNFTAIMNEMSSNFTDLTVHLREASFELRETLEVIHETRDKTKNIEKSKQDMIENFDDSMEHEFEKMNERLEKFMEEVSTQNELILKNFPTLKHKKSNLDV